MPELLIGAGRTAGTVLLILNGGQRPPRYVFRESTRLPMQGLGVDHDGDDADPATSSCS